MTVAVSGLKWVAYLKFEISGVRLILSRIGTISLHISIDHSYDSLVKL